MHPQKTFSMDGYTFEYSNFSNDHRNGCLLQPCTVGQEFESNTGEVLKCLGPSNICVNNWEPGSTVLHEFGHAMGMYHEHQNFIGGNPIQYDLDGAALFSMSQKFGACDPCVQEYCTKLCFDDDVKPNYCGSSDYCANTADYKCNPNAASGCQSKIDQGLEAATVNVLEKYDCDGKTKDECPYLGSFFDPESIMIYAVNDYMIKPNAQGKRENPTHSNYEYSKTDKLWLKTVYPLEVSNPPVIKVKIS